MSTFPLIDVQGLSKRFEVSAPWLERLINREPRKWVHAVNEVSLQIQRGETLALVGESGCGKSTLARLLVGLYAPTAGQIAFDGDDLHRTLASAQAQSLRRRMQMIFQDPYASLNPRWRVQDIVAEPLHVHRPELQAAQQVEAVEALLSAVGLNPKDAIKYPHQFSGGQRQRISIARALASAPDFLVCDEPTSALDVSVQARFLDLLLELQDRLKFACLFISHDLAVVDILAHRIAVMQEGKLVEIGDRDEILKKAKDPYTQRLIAAVPVPDPEEQRKRREARLATR